MQQATETAPTVQPPVAAPAQPGELTKDTYKGKSIRIGVPVAATIQFLRRSKK